MSIWKRPTKIISKKVISLEVKAVEKYVPDRLLLLLMNGLDTVPPETIDAVVNEVDKHFPSNVRSTIIDAADEYIPDSVANSRKITAVVAGVGKYVPDRVIPEKSRGSWANIKMKFHIPTLLVRDRTNKEKT